VVDFAYTNQTTYHPRIALTAAAGTTMKMQVIAGNCGGGNSQGCGSALDSWEVFGGGDPNGIGNGTPPYSPTPPAGPVYVRIYQTAGARTCADYTLNINN
jgi:hypothetical protein